MNGIAEGCRRIAWNTVHGFCLSTHGCSWRDANPAVSDQLRRAADEIDRLEKIVAEQKAALPSPYR